MMNYKIKSRIWIEVDDHVLLGHGRVKLLKSIEEYGSLSKAAKSLNISYKKAWDLIDAINKSSQKPIVKTAIGGKNGGGTKITKYGKELIIAFEEINKKCWEFLDLQTNRIENL